MKKPAPAPAPHARNAPNAPNARNKGWCALVGAGPGDPELLTLQALRTLRQATVLLVDDLVSDAVIQLALKGRKRQPRVLHVGKRGGCASTPQAFIERLMVQHALAGERVARVKGGDPFVFGRGGEEMQTLQAAGVDVRVVHGITAGLVATSALGAPWTHRDHAHGVLLVTGHARSDGVNTGGPNWPVLAAAAAQGITLVIYMGMAQLASLQSGLLQGLPAHTPAGVVQHAGTPQERQLHCTLGDLCLAVQAHSLGSPAIVVVGDVLRARQALASPAAHPFGALTGGLQAA